MRTRAKKIKGEICRYCDYSLFCNCPCKDAKEEARKKFKAQQRQDLRNIRKSVIGGS